MAKKREEIEDKLKWSTRTMFSSDEDWSKSLNEVAGRIEEISPFRGKLASGAETLKDFLALSDELEEKLEYVYTYAHLKHDEDTSQSSYQTCLEQSRDLFAKLGAALSFAEPELLAMDEATFENYLNHDELKSHRLVLKRLQERKPHVLSNSEERLLAELSPSLGVAEDCFRSFNDTDLRFTSVADDKGEDFDLTHGSYYSSLIHPDREFRTRAFKNYMGEYTRWSHLLSTTLYSHVRTAVTRSRLRSYPTALNAALKPKNIDDQVYLNLLGSVKDNIATHHRYLELRKRILGVDELQFYDLYLPMVEMPKKEHSVEESEALLLECLAPLGEEYLGQVKAGFDLNWIDWLENENKRSGAYSSGCYGSQPYILMNFDGTLNSVFTLAHEMGHSMHTYLSNQNQSYAYHNYPIFLAEVASIFNEHLLGHYLRSKAKSREEKLHLINHELEQIRTTFIRQTMFADFELTIHRDVEKGNPLTSESLQGHYGDLLEAYFSKHVAKNESITAEWSRIPHFYYNFYVYQYATGYAAALALSRRVLEGGEREQQDYLGFLKAGCSDDPLPILRRAGIDMTSKEPIDLVFEHMKNLLDEYENLLEDKS